MSFIVETVEFRGQRWFVTDAEWDESSLGAGSHWHLTLTTPQGCTMSPDPRIEAAAKALAFLWYGSDTPLDRDRKSAEVALAAADAVAPQTVLSTICASCGGSTTGASQAEKLAALATEMANVLHFDGDESHAALFADCESRFCALAREFGAVPPQQRSE